jgi:hypothetical protein
VSRGLGDVYKRQLLNIEIEKVEADMYGTVGEVKLDTITHMIANLLDVFNSNEFDEHDNAELLSDREEIIRLYNDLLVSFEDLLQTIAQFHQDLNAQHSESLQIIESLNHQVTLATASCPDSDTRQTLKIGTIACHSGLSPTIWSPNTNQ